MGVFVLSMVAQRDMVSGRRLFVFMHRLSMHFLTLGGVFALVLNNTRLFKWVTYYPLLRAKQL